MIAVPFVVTGAIQWTVKLPASIVVISAADIPMMSVMGMVVTARNGKRWPMCECHDSDAEHEVWITQEMAYWAAYFGDSVRRAVEEERFYQEEGIDVNDLSQLRRLRQ